MLIIRNKTWTLTLLLFASENITYDWGSDHVSSITSHVLPHFSMLDHRSKGREIGWLRGLRWHVLWWRRKTMALEEAILVVVVFSVVSARCFLFSFVTKDFFRDGWCVAFVFVLLQLMKPYAARIIFGAFAVTAVMAFCSRSWNMQSSAAWQKVTPDSCW